VSRPSLSLPHEHGGYLTLAGAAAAAALSSPRPLLALAAGIALVAAFFARGPLEALALGRPAPHDRAALAILAALAIAASAWTATCAGWSGAPALVAAPSVIGAAWVARRSRRHRTRAFELAGMGALGACAGAMALAGGAAPRIATALSLVFGAHAAAAVPLVRSELRPGERALARRDMVLALALLAAAALPLALVAPPRALLAFAPRLLQLGARPLRRSRPSPPLQVGLRETATLAAAVALASLTLR